MTGPFTAVFAEGDRKIIAHIVKACQCLAREPVNARDLFDFSSSSLHAVERMQARLID